MKKRISIVIAVVLFLLIVYAVKFRQYTIYETDELQPTGYAGEITKGQTYLQEFVCEKDRLEAVKLYISTSGRINNSEMTAELYQGEECLQTWKIDCRKLSDMTYYPLLLEKPLSSSAGRNYTLKITSDAEPGEGLSVYKNDTAGMSGLSVDGSSLPQTTMCYKLQYRQNGWNGYTLLGLFFIVVAAAVFWVSGRRYLGIEKQFLLLWVTFSILFLCSSPLFNVPDEIGHFFRSFEIAQGHPVSVFYEDEYFVGRDLPINTDLNVFKEDWQSFWENSDMTESGSMERSFYNTALYSPVSYLPQAAGIAIARVFTDNIALIAYCGRLAGWLCITLLFCTALRILPCGKEFLALIALMPMNLQEAASLAPDGMVVAVTAVMVAFTMHLRYGRMERLKLSHLFCLYLLAVFVSLNKIVYLPFCLIYLLIPSEKFGGMKWKALHAAVMAALVLALNLWWLHLCSGFLITQGVDSQRQILYLLQYPFEYGLTMFATWLDWIESWLQGMVGYTLAWMDVYVPGILVFAYLYLLMARLDPRFGKEEGERRKRGTVRCFQRNLLIFLDLAVLILISTSLYVQWTPLYQTSIGGIQGRYFIALLFPLYFAFHEPGEMAEKGRVTERRRAIPSMRLDELSLVTLINASACICLLFSSIRQG